MKTSKPNFIDEMNSKPNREIIVEFEPEIELDNDDPDIMTTLIICSGVLLGND